MANIHFFRSDIIAEIDDDLEEILSQSVWYINKRSHYAYRKGDRKALHRFIYELKHDEIPKGAEIDHINRNKLDCRANNLRAVSCSQNVTNRDIQENNTTGYCGVYFEKRRNVYVAYVTGRNKEKLLGSRFYFSDKRTAAIARDILAEQAYGAEFIVYNVPDVTPEERNKIIEIMAFKKRKTSKYFGVCKAYNGKWKAEFKRGENWCYLGYFEDESDAAKAVNIKLKDLGYEQRNLHD